MTISAPENSERGLRILVGADVPKDPNSGAAGTVYQTNQALRELGHEVDEIWADDIGRKIRHGNLHYLFELPRRYREVVRERCASKSYDVIELNQPHAYLAAIDHRRSKRSGIFVNRSHGLELRVQNEMPFWEKKFGIKPVYFPKSLVSSVIQKKLAGHWRLVAHYSDGIILPNYGDRDYLLAKLSVDESKVKTIHQGVSQQFLNGNQLEKTPEQMQKILYVGQYCFIKGPDILAQVINRVLSAHSKATFTWVCSQQHHPQVLNAIRPSLQARLQLLDWMPQYELDRVYDEHGLFIFPSFYEGFGKAPLEAMAKGLCVVASDTGGMREYIDSGKNGYVTKIGDVDGIVEIITQLLAAPDLASRIAKKAAIAAKAFTWKQCAQTTVEFYEFLLKFKRALESKQI